ncbi:MAG: gluconate 2-dehydrogenase subunit 3 family protein [Gemmatimonadaceae bacterium]
MFDSTTSRRAFLVAAGVGGAAWLLRDTAAVHQALEYAGGAVRRTPAPAFATLSPDEALQLAAVAERIIPSEDGPGAREAGVIFFSDRALGSFAAAELPLVRQGLADLDARARHLPGAIPFDKLEASQQDALLREVEAEPFFDAFRRLTIVGMFANPSWGGNRDEVGWKLLGFEPRMVHQPPFGYYDAQAMQEHKA